MLNRFYRNAVRNRPRNFRKFGRSVGVKRAGMSFKGISQASSYAAAVRPNYLRSRGIKRETEDRHMIPYRMRVAKRHREEISFAEQYLRNHPKLVKAGTSALDWIWDHGGRLVARLPLKRRRRGQLRGGTTYEEL